MSSVDETIAKIESAPDVNAPGALDGTRRASRSRMTRRPPWCSPVDDPAESTARLLERVRGTTTHAEAAERLGISVRTWLRWWRELVDLVPAEDLPERVAGGTSERRARGAATRAARVARIVGP
jgi:hypothetical protein